MYLYEVLYTYYFYCIALPTIGMRALDSDKGMLNAGGRLAERDVVQFVA